MPLIGGVDECIPKQKLAGRLLGADMATTLGEGSNWMLIGTEANSAIGTFEMIPEELERTQLHQLLSTVKAGTYLAFSKRFSDVEASEIMAMHAGCIQYCYEESCGYYETLPLYVLNRFLLQENGRLIHIDVCEERFMVMNIDNSDFERAPR